MLLTAVESCGADLGSCVLVSRQQHQMDDYYAEQHQENYRHHRYYRSRHHRSSSLENDDDQNSESEDSCASPVRPDRCRVPVRGSFDNSLIDPHLLCCQIWRWPDLAHSSELKRLPVCHSAKDPVYICCNPYHWSRLCKPESPPPPYCHFPDRLRPEDRAPSEGDQRRCKNSTPLPLPGSLTTNGEGEMGQKEWCTLAYWELGGRVGRLYPVEPSTVNVFDSLHDGDGLCLATLAENHVASPVVQRTRSKIGLGLMLSQEADGVWAYNRSESPIFVNSPTLDDPESRTLLVYRVSPGFCLNIFDRTKILQLPYGNGTTRMSNQASGFASGPVDINSVRISFAKGWGPKYSRQEVTSCPCWLEVLLAPCR
ncbi:Mothers against decapentaplegic like protein 6 [Habropoda laboriosa]|uniref:Mothers against decapentaplegic like protein 6 n=2 Tax=Habropoda laboriosa TaxID=597456 RepID=A0A0L7QLV9_9HYME|nr:Mothers against decapentaplegic like protein 6 [Habropoda laboriosa]